MTPGAPRPIEADHPDTVVTARERLATLHAELAEEVRERVLNDVCGCGCGARLASRKAGRRYVDERHRQRAYRHRLELEARALAIPARLSLQALRQYEPTEDRHADAQEPAQAPKRRRSSPRPGVTVYLPSLELAEQLARELREVLDPGSQRGLGARVEARALLDAVEAALERRRRRETPPAAA